MMKNSINKMLIICLLFTFSNIALSKEFRVGVIDTQRILNESSYVKDIEKRVIRECQPKNEELEKLYKKLQNKITYLKRDKEILTDKEKINKEREITKMQQTIQEMAQELDFDYREMQKEEHFNLNQVVEKVTEGVAIQEKIDVVFQKPALLYSHDDLDITDIILIKLETEYKKK